MTAIVVDVCAIYFVCFCVLALLSEEQVWVFQFLAVLYLRVILI